MTAASSLRAALGKGYRHSMRLVLLNCAVGVVVVLAAAGAAYALPLALLAVAAGPLVAALVHCAVVVTQTDELGWSDARDGLRLHWRVGLALGALGTVGIAFGLLAIRFYSQPRRLAARSARGVRPGIVLRLAAGGLATRDRGNGAAARTRGT